MSGAELVDVAISGEIVNPTVNEVEVAALVTAELDRRYPERALMRPSTPAGFQQAWVTLERLWDGTVQRARGLDPALLYECVDGEWSFIETLRHLVFASDAWVLQLRRERTATVRTVIGGLTEQSLAVHTAPVEGPGRPEPRSYPVRECLLAVLNEE